MNYLLSGSFAYDTILLHKGHFHTRILPESISRLNVSFGIDQSKQEFGGTAGNIAYNASLLHSSVLLCSSVGKDFERYGLHLEENNIPYNSLTHFNNLHTAHSWILTDQSNNQITGFHKGAMDYTPTIPKEAYSLPIWHLAPDLSETTAYLAKTAIKNKIKYFLDPGQSLPSFLEGDSEHIIPFESIVFNSAGMFVNEYESQLLQDKFKKPLKDFFQGNIEFIVETLGSKGLILHTRNNEVLIPIAKTNIICDPTGCGDAFRAGFLYGYINKMDLKSCSELGAVMGSFAIECFGGQNHKPTIKEISARLFNNFEWQLNK